MAIQADSAPTPTREVFPVVRPCRRVVRPSLDDSKVEHVGAQRVEIKRTKTRRRTCGGCGWSGAGCAVWCCLPSLRAVPLRRQGEGSVNGQDTRPDTDAYPELG